MSVLLFIRDLIVATFGNRGVYLVAWLGTPLHELGHALFCVIFLHKIVEIKFFSPDPVNGTLGYVYHKWNKKNPWHILGNFFIGIGPVILGCAVLFGLFYLLIPGSSRVWDTVLIQANTLDSHSVGSYLAVWGDSSLALVRLIFTVANLAGWRFWVFLYLAICISSNIRLSWSDFKHALSGIGCIVLIFLLINLIGLITGAGGEAYFPATAAWLGAVYGVLILALVMALAGFIIIYIIAAAYYRMRYRILLKPF